MFNLAVTKETIFVGCVCHWIIYMFMMRFICTAWPYFSSIPGGGRFNNANMKSWYLMDNKSTIFKEMQCKAATFNCIVMKLLNGNIKIISRARYKYHVEWFCNGLIIPNPFWIDTCKILVLGTAHIIQYLGYMYEVYLRSLEYARRLMFFNIPWEGTDGSIKPLQDKNSFYELINILILSLTHN